jgi:hypothetical protein
MTVTVTLPDAGTDKYMRFGDACVKHTRWRARRHPHRREAGFELRIRRVD